MMMNDDDDDEWRMKDEWLMINYQWWMINYDDVMVRIQWLCQPFLPSHAEENARQSLSSRWNPPA